MAETIALFAIKTIGLSTAYDRKPCTLLEAARHNLREIQAELGAVGKIDAQRMGDNVNMAGPATAAQVQADADALLASVDTSRLKRDHVQAIEAAFSLPATSSIDVGAYFAQCLAWLRVALPLPVLSAVVHRDEDHPHMHVLTLPLKDRKHIGGELIDKPKLMRLRESFFQKVAGPAGLKRDSAKLRGNVKRWAVDAVLRVCEEHGLPGGMGPLWPVFRGMVEKDPTPWILALEIDVNTLRESANPIALGESPIALGSAIESKAVLDGSKIQGLSCVALPTPTPQKFTKKAPPEVPSTAHAVADMGTYKQLAHWDGGLFACAVPARLMAARTAQQAALAKTCRQRQRVSAGPVVRVDDGGIIRERGGDGCHDLSAWED